MGCTPSSSAGVYSHDTVCRDLDTCSTFVPSVKSSVSTPERPRLQVDPSNVRQTFLRVPCRDVHGRSVSQSSQSSQFESWSSADGGGGCSSSCGSQSGNQTGVSTESLNGSTEDLGAA